MKFCRFNIQFLLFICVLIMDCRKPEPKVPVIQYISAKGGLNMREIPDGKGKVITLIPQNSEVNLIETEQAVVEIGGKRGHWAKIRFKEKEGFVFDGFLIKDPPSVDYSEKSGGWGGVDLMECQNSTEPEMGKAPPMDHANVIIFQPDFKVTKENYDGNIHEYFNYSGTYSTSPNGEKVIIRWTKRNWIIKDPEKNSSSKPKEPISLDQEEILYTCDCKGSKALCGVGVVYTWGP